MEEKRWASLVRSQNARNAKADQRRTTDTALQLDSIRRLIQRLVRPNASQTLGPLPSAPQSARRRCLGRGSPRPTHPRHGRGPGRRLRHPQRGDIPFAVRAMPGRQHFGRRSQIERTSAWLGLQKTLDRPNAAIELAKPNTHSHRAAERDGLDIANLTDDREPHGDRTLKRDCLGLRCSSPAARPQAAAPLCL